jgi:hypothetical protein
LGANFGQTLTYVKFACGDYGGDLNLMPNRQFVNFGNFKVIHGQIIAGVKVNVLSGGTGNDSGEIELRGRINDQRWWGHLATGGQELWIDDSCWEKSARKSRLTWAAAIDQQTSGVIGQTAWDRLPNIPLWGITMPSSPGAAT